MSFRSPKSDIHLHPFVSINRTTTKGIIEGKGVIFNLYHNELERRKKIRKCYKKRNNLNSIIVI